MTQPAARQVTRTWGILVLLTILSLAASHSGQSGLAVNGLLLAAAFAKGRWMLLDFLKLRDVPPGWRVLLLTWLLLVCASAWIAAAASSFRA